MEEYAVLSLVPVNKVNKSEYLEMLDMLVTRQLNTVTTHGNYQNAALNIFHSSDICYTATSM